MRAVPVSWPDPDTCVRDQSCSVIANLELASRLLERIEPGSADLVCLPEAFLTEGVRYSHAHEVARHAQDVRSAAVGWARRLRATVCVPLVRADGDCCFNSVEVLDSDGSLQGVYDKLHPWPSAADLTVLEYGVSPGARATPIVAGACLLGIQTCFDVHWPKAWLALAAAGARLVVFPSEYPGGLPLQMRAREAGVTIVAAVLHGPSRIVDPAGIVVRELDASSFPCVVNLNLNRTLVHLDHQEDALTSLIETQVGVHVRRVALDNVALVEAPPDGARVEDLLETAGIQPLMPYLAAAKHAIEAQRRAGAAQQRE